MSKATITVPKAVYNGSAAKPSPTVKAGSKTLKNGTDYTVSYKNNTKTGTATATITGKGNCSGSKTVKFAISPAPASSFSVSKIAACQYTGKAHTPKPQVKFAGGTLKEGRDYKLEYKSNTKAGTALVKVVAKGGSYTGTKTVKFTISPKPLSACYTWKVDSQSYVGKAVKPKVSIKFNDKPMSKDSRMLEEGKDYKVSYSNNVKVGTATATIKGIGNYSGTMTRKFKIVKRSPGDNLARAMCRMAYSRKSLLRDGYDGTSVWKKVYKAVDTNGAKTKYRKSCCVAVNDVVRWSGYGDGMPWGYGGMSSYLRGSSQWKIVTTSWNKSTTNLKPGDILVSFDHHEFMYVGSDIAQEIYDCYLVKTDADRGRPQSDAVFVSAHLTDGGGACPCIGNASYALAGAFTYTVARPTASVSQNAASTWKWKKTYPEYRPA